MRGISSAGICPQLYGYLVNTAETPGDPNGPFGSSPFWR